MLFTLTFKLLDLRCSNTHRINTFMIIGAGPRDQPSGFMIANQQATINSLTSYGPISYAGTCRPFFESCAMVQVIFHRLPRIPVIGEGQHGLGEYTNIESSLRQSEEQKENSYLQDHNHIKQTSPQRPPPVPASSHEDSMSDLTRHCLECRALSPSPLFHNIQARDRGMPLHSISSKSTWLAMMR